MKSNASVVWQRVRNVPGLRGDIASLAVLVAIAIACASYIFSQYGLIAPWSKQYVFSAEFAKLPGVRPASRQEVRIAGVSVGRITDATVASDGNARLTMSIDPGQVVYTNARVMLRTKAPLDIMYVALDPGGPPGTPLPAGGVIPVAQTARPIQPFEVLDNLNAQTRDALTSLLNESDAALMQSPQNLSNGLNATDGAMNSFRPVLQQLATRRQTIASLVTSIAQISQAIGGNDVRMGRLANSLNTALGVVAAHDTQVKAALAQVPGLSTDLNSSMTGVSALTVQLNPTLRSLAAASGALPGTLNRLSSTLQTAGQLISVAGPAVSTARSVFSDLRPLSSSINTSLSNLQPTARLLPTATQKIVPWLGDLSAFVYQTSSAFSLADASGGWGRALLTLIVDDPSGGLKPQPDIGKDG